MNDVIEEETEEQQHARILRWKSQRALQDAPALMMHMRELIPTPERGEFDTHMWSPMRLNPTDDSDAFYAGIINWVTAWTEYLNEPGLTTAAVAWSNDKEVQGFRANTRPSIAAVLTRRQTGWLLDHLEQMEGHEHELTFLQDVVFSIAVLRSRYPLAPRRPRPISLHPCPVCQHLAVGADWMGYGLTYVQIKCENCWWTPDKNPKPSELLKWLRPFTDTAVPLSQECEAGEHAAVDEHGIRHGCESLACGCDCHDWESAEVGHGQQVPIRDNGTVPRFPASTAIPDPRVCPICHLHHPEGACQ